MMTRGFVPKRGSGMNTSLPVLVIDDSSTMTTIISKLVRDVGFTDIDQVNDGPSALDRLRDKKFGLIFSDWDMRPFRKFARIRRTRALPSS
jgi:two-component system, chemotaxis family, chemotaxis protein CheY